MLPRARKALLSAMWIICVFYYYSFWPLVLHTKKVTLLSCSRNSCIMCVHISWQVKNIGEKPRSNMVNQRTLTHAHQEALHSSLFVSYLYNYFKVSTDFGFPFREKTIKPCSPGLSGWVSYHHIVTVCVSLSFCKYSSRSLSSPDDKLSENIWFVWSKTSYDGDKWRCHHGDDER